MCPERIILLCVHRKLKKKKKKQNINSINLLNLVILRANCSLSIECSSFHYEVLFITSLQIKLVECCGIFAYQTTILQFPRLAAAIGAETCIYDVGR